MTDAMAFLDRAETDGAFASALEIARGNPVAVLEALRAAGFDATPDEILSAIIERYGAELTAEQLEQIAAAGPEGTAYFFPAAPTAALAAL